MILNGAQNQNKTDHYFEQNLNAPSLLNIPAKIKANRMKTKEYIFG